MRAAAERSRKDLTFVAVNDLGTAKANAHLLKWDSVHGPFPGKVKSGKDWLDLGQGRITVLAERDPAKLPWQELGIDVVMECTGLFASRDAAAKHLDAGAKRVLISAPASGADLTVVYGVNEDKLRKKHTVVSNASCTTNCLAPVGGGPQPGGRHPARLHDDDPQLHRRSSRRRPRCTRTCTGPRGAATAMIPTTTGAARAVGLVLPELAGKLGRHGGACADAQRLDGRPGVRSQTQDHRRRD